MKHTFYSHGKLLLTAEYVVLDGAKALAVPTKFGQALTAETIDNQKGEQKLVWKSIDHEGLMWFESEFTHTEIKTGISNNSDSIHKRLAQLLHTACILNPKFLHSMFKLNCKILVTSKLDFPTNWGLGSSSTLINNIAQWATVDAFELSHKTFGGSGYDIACAQNNTPIIYTLKNNSSKVTLTAFKKPFESLLFFIHLNKKQDSRVAIQQYKKNKANTTVAINKINQITRQLLETNSFEIFEGLIKAHETIIGDITKQTPVKTRLFSDYEHEIKSLGGWGGDFVLATGESDYVHTYFKSKGYKTIIPYNMMVLQ